MYFGSATGRESMLPASFQIRDLTIRPAAVLAPMAGVTDTLFRRVIRGLGSCGLLMTEFTSSEGITRSAAKTLRYLYFLDRTKKRTKPNMEWVKLGMIPR